MKIKSKISAFTLGELLVVMVISSIVVTLSFLALSNMNRQMRNINKAFETRQSISELERIILTDLQDSNESIKNKRRLYFIGNLDTVRYQISDGYITREKDTFFVAVKKKRFYYKADSISFGKFDAVKFEFNNTYGNTSFFIFKHLDASHFMNK